MAITNTPSTIDAIQTTQMFSSLNINEPSVYNELVLSRGQQGAELFDIIKMLGQVKGISQEKRTHFEDDWDSETIHNLNSVTNNVAGGSVNIVLSPQDLDAQFKFYARQYFFVRLPNGLNAQISNITGQGTGTVTLTLKPQKAAGVVGTIPAGQELYISMSAFDEGSFQPDGVVSKTRQFDFYLQIMKEKFNITGSAATNSTWFDKFSDGTGLTQYAVKGQRDMDYRMKQQMFGAFMWGDTTDNVLVGPQGGPIVTTQGLDSFIQQNGNNINYNSGTWSVSKFDEMVTITDREFTPEVQMFMMGPSLSKQNENALVDYFKNTNIVYARDEVKNKFFKGDEGMTTNIGFSYLTKAGHTFCFKTLKVLDHPKMTGAQGYTETGNGYLIPLGEGKDAKTKEGVPYFSINYKMLGNDNRMMKVFKFAGAGPDEGSYVTEQDIINYNMRVHAGAEFFAGNQMVRVIPI